MELNKFSVISTNVEYDRTNNIIRKTYSMNVHIDITTIELKTLIDKYLLSIQDINIPISKIVNSYVEGDHIVYESEYCGRNIIELGFDISKFDNFKIYIAKMLEIVKLAKDNDLYFDPHPKNFVFNGDNDIFYVDFFPPYTDYLKDKRLHSAKNSEIQIIDENYQFFTKGFLAEHFCGDFLNIDLNAEKIFEQIYSMSKDIGLYSGSLNDFVCKAKYIRHIEDVRLKKNIFLL